MKGRLKELFNALRFRIAEAGSQGSNTQFEYQKSSTTTLESFQTVLSKGVLPQSDMIESQLRQEPSIAVLRMHVPGNETIAAMPGEISLKDAIPYISVGDDFGSTGSREFAEDLDAVVAIASGGTRYCSGVLIGPDLILSARHCDVAIGDSVVFGSDFNNSEFIAAVSQVDLPAGVGETWFDGGDIALLTLNQVVPADVATPLRLTSATDELVGSIATIAGYGLNGVGSTGHNSTSDGFRWGGQNILDHYGPFGPDSDNLFAADFDDGSQIANTLGGALDSNNIPLNTEAITTAGDSGSPLLIESDGELLVAGVTSGGLDIGGKYGSITWWTGVAPFFEEITAAGGDVAGDVGGGTNGSLPTEDDHGNSNSQFATNLEFSSPVGNSLVARDRGNIGFGNFIDDTDVFRFTTSETGRLIIDAKATSGGLDTVIRVQDSDGNVIGQNNNSGVVGADNPKDSKLVLKDLPRGEYFVSVRGANSTTGGFRVAARSTAQVQQVASQGSNFADATVVLPEPFSPTTSINGTIGTVVDKDFFQFTATTSGRFVARTKALSNRLNTVLRVYDQNRITLDQNNNFKGSLDSRVSFDVVAGQSYYLKIGSAKSTKGDYRITLRNLSGTGSGASPFVNLNFDSNSSSAGMTGSEFADRTGNALVRQTVEPAGVLAAL